MQPNLAISLLPVDILAYLGSLTTNRNELMLLMEKKSWSTASHALKIPSFVHRRL